MREQHIFGNVNKQHNGLLSLFRYMFPAMLKFCSIETAFRERQISSFILICWFIVSEVYHRSFRTLKASPSVRVITLLRQAFNGSTVFKLQAY